MPGLGASFGRGAATNYQQDMANSDCILFMGSNMAEAQPVGFRWPMKAKEKGATLIHVDPRFTRTSALCDVFVDPAHQGHGLGSFLVETAVGHPAVAAVPQVLATEPGRTLYARHGYAALARPERWMERRPAS